MVLWSHMTSRSFVFAGLLTSLVLTGFGCKKTPDPSSRIGLFQRSPTESNVQKPWAPDPNKPRDQDNQIIPEIEYLRQVMKNFTLVTSFRANLALPVEGGVLRALMEAQKDQGIHAQITLPNATQSELYLIRDSAYIRSGTSTWQTYTNTNESRQLQALFAQAFTLNSGASTTKFISDSSRLVDVKETNQGCKNYRFSQYSRAGNKVIVSLCVSNDLPKIMTVPTDSGDMRVEYSDYNQPFEIRVPTNER